MTETKKTYRLYALPLDGKNMEAAAKERFSRATPLPAPGYILIYTSGEKPADAEEITPERVSLLSPADMLWLTDSNSVILAEETQGKQTEVLQRLSEHIVALESELKRKREELQGKGEQAE